MADRLQDEFVFVALGGLGEIGRNAALYGYGAGKRRKWIMADCGLSFAGPHQPGVELVYPDIAFIETIKHDLLGLVITHAHEDHVGAIAALWPQLNCPVYATRFALGLLEARRLGEPGAPLVPLKPIAPGRRFSLGPFDIEPVAVAHSIPESCALAIRTPLGMAIHTGDWKLDRAPGIGAPTDVERFRQLGDEGALALICDSTNIVRDGSSPSEGEVAEVLAKVIAQAPARVVVTTFASNLARIRAVALAAQAANRSVVICGRSLDRVISVGRECGYLEGVRPFLSAHSFRELDKRECVVIATGSQGESRAAMARIAQGEHPVVKLTPGDQVIFSSRTIPGNERPVNRIINSLIDRGLEVITDRTHLVHCSGHPRRDEVAELYRLVRPGCVIPAHGEALHLHEQARFAKDMGVPHVLEARNGDLVRLAPGLPEKIDVVPTGVLLADGDVLISGDDQAVAERVRLAFAGVVSIGLALTAKGDLAGEPDVLMAGVPTHGRNGESMDALAADAIFETFDNLPRARRRDPDAVCESIERAVRAALSQAWGKKTQVHVLVMEV